MLDDHHVLGAAVPEPVVDHVPEPEVLRHLDHLRPRPDGVRARLPRPRPQGLQILLILVSHITAHNPFLRTELSQLNSISEY